MVDFWTVSYKEIREDIQVDVSSESGINMGWEHSRSWVKYFSPLRAMSQAASGNQGYVWLIWENLNKGQAPTQTTGSELQ